MSIEGPGDRPFVVVLEAMTAAAGQASFGKRMIVGTAVRRGFNGNTGHIASRGTVLSTTEGSPVSPRPVQPPG